MMQLEVENRQKVLRIQARDVKCAARYFAGRARVDLGEVTIILVDDAGIAPINVAAVGHQGATDVITLPCEAIPGAPASAEIIINAQRALAQSPEDPIRELFYYLAHAFDHLSGRDDAAARDRTAMHRRERRWLREFLQTERTDTCQSRK